ncbi:MAG: hypothetical protein JXQ29_08400 [Planctomycetes bacterium]|nr:hypothetical protein [Planctomycetota bacterium]
MATAGSPRGRDECLHLDRFARIEHDIRRVNAELNGNGRAGVREELIELRVSVRAMTRIGWIVLGVVLVNLAGAIYRVVQ